MVRDTGDNNMTTCRFIYRRANGSYLAGDRCPESATESHHTVCKRHRKVLRLSSAMEGEQHDIVDNSFPRIFTDEEERACVDEARRRTSPEGLVMRSCVVCGRLHIGKNLLYVTEKELLKWRHLLCMSNYYAGVPVGQFMYGGPHTGLDCMVLDRLGFMNANEVVDGSPLMLRVCRTCNSSLAGGRLPDLALANGLWTGAGSVPELDGLSWIEEKLIARCHLSIQIQKCREVKQWHIDAFHPQRQLRGNITTFPVDPTVSLNRLPLSGRDMVGLIKVVFM
jgi:hypothetical protein